MQITLTTCHKGHIILSDGESKKSPQSGVVILQRITVKVSESRGAPYSLKNRMKPWEHNHGD